MKETYLLIGLGNPGREYRLNRHNFGFMIVDNLSKELNIGMNRMQAKAIVGNGHLNDDKIILAKPQTFMNLSGQAVKNLINFYKVPLEHLLIIHDDLDLPLGSIRLRPTGGPGGQKGIKNTIELLGTQDFPRLRLGIGRPPGRMDAVDYVLQDFLKSEEDILKLTISQATEAAISFLKVGLQQTMNKYNGTLDH